jgi:CHAT domain-containing protein/Tfp pilus assembly protein PilF
LQLQRGDLNGALQQADQELKKFPDQDTEWHWKFRTLKAEALLRKRLSQDALDLLRPAVPPSLAASDIAVWRRLTEGSAAAYLYQFADADRFLGSADSLATQYHPELLGQVALRKGTLALLQGDIDAAESNYRTALEAARKQNDSFLETASLGSLGLIATRQEHYDESIELNREALQLSENVGAQGSTTNILSNIAWGLFELGDYDGSLKLYQQAEDSAQKEGNPGEELTLKVDVGALDYYVRDYSSAESNLRDALDLGKKLNQQSQIAASLNALAALFISRGQMAAAESYNQQAATVCRATSDHAGEISTELTEAQIDSAKNDRADAEQILQSVLRDPQAEPSSRWEAQARLATVYADAGKPADAERQFRSAIATIEAARNSVQEEELRLSFLSNAIEFYDDYVEFLVAQHRTREALDVATLTRAQTLVEGLGLRSAKHSAPPADWSEAARREHATILSYWLGPRHSYLWAIPPAGPAQFFMLPSADEIEPVVRSYSEAMLGPRDPLGTANPDGEKLFATLVAPAIGLIPKGSRVVIVPDASLFGLNFEALPVPGGVPHYWIEDVTVVNANSMMLVASGAATARPSRGKLLLIGDPVSPSDDFPTLPQAGTEISDIKTHFPAADTTVITGASATPQAYLASRPGQFSYIHFAAHGTSSEATPLESAVILSRQGDSFKLYGRDVVKLPLRGALVTISACHGAGSRNYSGEGLVGLSWAFLRAGAHAVIAALWEVDDASTASLMDHFYDRLSKGDDPATALRAAKLTLLHSGTVYQKPFYWAPFQYYAGS